MRSRLQGLVLGVFAAALAGLAIAPPAHAQSGAFGKPLQGLNGGPLAGATTEDVVEAHGRILPPPAGRPAVLEVTASIQPPWHIYSVTQKPGGPTRSKIKVTPSADFQLAGEFQAVTPPTSHAEPLFNNLVVEEHSGDVVWRAPLQLSPGVDLQSVKIAGAVFAQACADSCIPPKNYPFQATLAPSSEAPAATVSVARPAQAPTAVEPQAGIAAPPAPPASEYRRPRSHAALRGRIEPAAVAPGGNARLLLSATPDPRFHIYALADHDPKQPGTKPTLIALAPRAVLTFGTPAASTAPIVHRDPAVGVQEIYTDKVTWTVEIRVAADAAPGDYPIEGVIGYLTCSNVNCDPPAGARFHAVLQVGSPEAVASVPLAFSEGNYADAAQLAEGQAAQSMVAAGRESNAAAPAAEGRKLELVELNSGGTKKSFLFVIVSSLLGGALLNLMPCVLPVIGLKVLSFAQQGGQSRGRVLALNLWYTAGLMLVFMVLATLAAGATLGLSKDNLEWGQQFSSTTFNVVMCGLVFAMALSFLGVWEIPLPGFIGTGKATELAAQEGAAGAFFKGVMSTILATPCSGPFLGPVFGFTLRQPPYVTYLVFACVGLGMATPYLLIGLFPSLVRMLPRPGAWMDTFKQLMGFVLLGTVVFLFTSLNRDYLVATFAMLIGVWAGCWWIGRTPLTADLGRRLTAWAQGAAVAAAIGWFGFSVLVTRPALLPWQPFTPAAPAQLASAGKTVLVDFTADWCLTCQANLKFAIDTEEVRQLVDANGVVPLIADWTDGSDDIKEALNSLESRSIPVLAIYPADHPEKALILRDVITKGQLLDALKLAGPSRNLEPAMSTAQSSRTH